MGDPDSEYRTQKRPGDSDVAVLAGRQQGVVARWQLIELGFSASAITRRIAAGRLHPIFRGVYAVGHGRLTRKGRWMAAVLACGPEAVLSHRSAAALWNFPVGGGAAAVDVTVPGRTRSGQEGITVHRVRRLSQADRTLIDNIPVTTWPRTLLDEAEVLGRERLRSMVEASERLDLFDFSLIEETIARNRGRRGIKPLRAVARQLKGPAPDTRSGKERTFLELVRAAGLPEPSVNVVVLGDVADYYWPVEQVVVEIDSYKYHRSRRKFEEDRARDCKRQLAGLACLRVTETRMDSEPHRVVRDVETMLRLRRAS